MNPTQEALESMPWTFHGGIVTMQQERRQEDFERFSQALTAAIDRGVAALKAGSAKGAEVLEPVPGAAVEIFSVFDVETGAHHAIWRIACQVAPVDRSQHTN